MRVLIIGGGGFLGTQLTKEFIDKGTKVISIDRMDYASLDDIPKSEHLTFIDDEIINIEDYYESFEGFDRIVYLASPRLLELDEKDTIENELTNLKFVLNKVQEECTNDFLFFFASSCSVYGRQDSVIKFSEEDKTQITTRYSELKIKSENLIKEIDSDNFKIFRLSTLYGLSNPMRNDILINNLIYDIKTGKDLEIFDPEANRPHLNVHDCKEILFQLIVNGFEEKILNVGYDDLNISKKGVVKIIEKVLDTDLNVTYVDSKDSRDYSVDFSKVNKYIQMWYNTEKIEYEQGIFNLWVDKINLSLEDYDSIIDHVRPNMSSKTWYLKEEGELSYPKMWGRWNVYNETTNKLFSPDQFSGMITPINEKRYVRFLDTENSKKKEHIYLVPIYNPSFFEDNIKIGYSCISRRYLRDIKNGKCKIVFLLTLEGYSGSTNNRDLEIIAQWNDEHNIPHESVYYICGNLKVKSRIKQKNLNFNGIPLSSFDIWINPLHMPDEICPFHPSADKFLYLSYNRNMDRTHRIGFCSRLLDNDLLDLGTVSVGDFDLNYVDTEKYPNASKLKKMVPIEIDKTLQYNLANDISHDNFHNTFVSIVTESLCDENTLFLSEKTWKPIYMGHPFIVLGNPGTLRYLKTLGFKTFDKWWDESYDRIQDLDARTNKIVTIIKHLSNKNHEYLINVRQEMKDILIHNRSIMVELVKKKYHIRHDEYNPQKPIIKLLADIQNKMI